MKLFLKNFRRKSQRRHTFYYVISILAIPIIGTIYWIHIPKRKLNLSSNIHTPNLEVSGNIFNIIQLRNYKLKDSLLISYFVGELELVSVKKLAGWKSNYPVACQMGNPWFQLESDSEIDEVESSGDTMRRFVTFRPMYSLSLNHISADALAILSDTLSLCILTGSSFNTIDISSRPIGSGLFKLKGRIDSLKLPEFSLNENYWDLGRATRKRKEYVSLSYKNVQNVNINRCFDLYVNNSVFSSNTEISCSETDTVRMDSVDLVGQVLLKNKQLKKVVLALQHVNCSQLDIDYTSFTYDPYITDIKDKRYWIADVEDNFKGIIRRQRLKKNPLGVEEATIDSAVFEDEQHIFGDAVVFIKRRWNNYGFDKEQVVGSSLELFCIFAVINFFWFGLMLQEYEISYIKVARKESFNFKKYRGIPYRILLSLLYSGFIFYGLRFDFSNLRINKIGLSVFLIAQYVLGIISLAYIANLIITK
jgi:hypothetical protein